MVGMLLIYVLFAVFTWVMTITQMRQVAHNVTTNELINWVRYPAFQREDGSFKNPYDRGVCNNLRQFLRGWPGSHPATPRSNNSTAETGEYVPLSQVEYGGERGTEVVLEMGIREQIGSSTALQSDSGEQRDLDESTRRELNDLGFDDP